MAADSLKVEQNADGTFTVEWDKDDPNWSWMNNHTSKEILCWYDCSSTTS